MKHMKYAQRKTWNGMNGLPAVIDFASAPSDYMAGGFERYYEHGLSMGSFGDALLKGQLFLAMQRADFTNKEIMPELAFWIMDNFTPDSYGSPEIVDAWIKSGGALNQ